MTVAIRAQKKLLHIVLILKLLVISSIENMTPPIGEPNATATPAALDAVSISRIFPMNVNVIQVIHHIAVRARVQRPTMTLREASEPTGNHAPDRARDVNGGTFLAD